MRLFIDRSCAWSRVQQLLPSLPCFPPAPGGIESCPEQQSASLHDWEQFRTIFQVYETKAHGTEEPGIEPQIL